MDPRRFIIIKYAGVIGKKEEYENAMNSRVSHPYIQLIIHSLSYMCSSSLKL